jgi:alkylhydroperoxidase/carboxymuconolactone decarboxylase family protein YurZ
MFELCDTWVNTTVEDDYVDFIIQMQTAHREYQSRHAHSISRRGVAYKTLWKRSATHIKIAGHWAAAAKRGGGFRQEGALESSLKSQQQAGTALALKIAHTSWGSDKQRLSLVVLLGRLDGEWQAAALALFGSSNLDDETKTQLLELLAGGTAEQQKELLAVLGQLDGDSQAALLVVLAGCTVEQRKELLAAMGQLDSESQAALLKLFVGSTAEEREELLAMLGKLDSSAKVHLLQALAGCNAEQRKELLAVLVYLDGDSRAAMLKLFAGSTAEEQDALLEVLGGLDDGAVKRILRALGGLDEAGANTLLKHIARSTKMECQLVLGSLLRASKSNKKMNRIIGMLQGRQQERPDLRQKATLLTPLETGPPADIEIEVQKVREFGFGGAQTQRQQDQAKKRKNKKHVTSQPSAITKSVIANEPRSKGQSLRSMHKTEAGRSAGRGTNRKGRRPGKDLEKEVGRGRERSPPTSIPPRDLPALPTPSFVAQVVVESAPTGRALAPVAIRDTPLVGSSHPSARTRGLRDKHRARGKPRQLPHLQGGEGGHGGGGGGGHRRSRNGEPGGGRGHIERTSAPSSLSLSLSGECGS